MFKHSVLTKIGESQVKNGVVEPLSGTKPLFISLLTDALATEGDATTLECAVTGDPTPTVTWSLNNNAVQPSNRIKVWYLRFGLVKRHPAEYQ